MPLPQQRTCSSVQWWGPVLLALLSLFQLFWLARGPAAMRAVPSLYHPAPVAMRFGMNHGRVVSLSGQQ